VAEYLTLLGIGICFSLLAWIVLIFRRIFADAGDPAEKKKPQRVRSENG